MFLRSLPLRLYHSGDSFMASMKHKSQLRKEGGERRLEQKGIISQVQSPDFAPLQLLPLCLFLLLVILLVAPQDTAATRV